MENVWKLLAKYHFQTGDAVNLDLVCRACKRILIKPLVVSCGCKYCSDCLYNYLDGERKICIGDPVHCQNEYINPEQDIFIDTAACINISRIIVKCPIEFCAFKSELKNMTDHLVTCNQHLVNCPFKTIGCPKNEITVDEIKFHIDQECHSHFTLLMEVIANLQNEIKSLEKDLAELKEDTKILKKIGTDTKKDITISAKENRSHECVDNNCPEMDNKAKQTTTLKLQRNIENPDQEMENDKQYWKKLEEKFNERWNDIQMNLEKMKTTMNPFQDVALETYLTSFQIRKDSVGSVLQCDSIENYGEFVWCIKDWSGKMKLARNGMDPIIWSDPFYSHKNGYKMCLRVHPNGSDKGKNNYLSVFVCIMRGMFDSILQWPFHCGVRLDLMNQETGLAHVSKTLKFETDQNCSISLKKPISDRNKGIGYHSFIELSELALNEALCRDNQIWIKAIPSKQG